MKPYDIIVTIICFLIVVCSVFRYSKKGCASTIISYIMFCISLVVAFALSFVAGENFGHIFSGKTGELPPDGVAMAIAFLPIMVVVTIILNLIGKKIAALIKPMPVLGKFDKILGALLGFTIGVASAAILFVLASSIKQIMNI